MFKKILLFTIIILFFPLLSRAAILYTLPQSQEIWQGDSFVVEIWLDTEGEIINTIEGSLVFPQDKLEALKTSEGGSVLSLWPKPPSSSNENGLIDFAGGIPNGFSGNAKLFSATFRVNSSIDQRNSASLNFKKNSRVFLNDGEGSPVLLNFGEGDYQLVRKPENLPIITSSSHSNQDKWYTKSDFDLKWKLIKGTEYSYLLSHDSLASPDEIADTPDGTLMWQGDITYKGLAEGIYYFHLRQGVNGKWTPKITYKAMIDSSPPESFQLEVAKIKNENYLIFMSSDNISGIDYYEVKEGDGEWQKARSPYLLKNQKLGEKILAKAVDMSGNEKMAEYLPAPLTQEQNQQPTVIVSLILLAGMILLLLKKYVKKFKPSSYLLFFILYFLMLFPAGGHAAETASLYLSPSSGTFFIGSTFNVSVFVNTGDNNINVVKADLKFDPKKVQIASPTAGKSLISVWLAQPSYSNIEGTASFQGGIPSPGVNTSSGLISTITFRAIAPGEATISFSDSSKVLLDNGKGTNILNSLNRGAYRLIIPPPEGPEVFSPTHLDQNKWYGNNSPTISWTKDEGVNDFSYSLDNSLFGDVDNVSEGDNTSISYSDLEDGIWYFHIKAKNGNIWGGISHYILQIDKTPPAYFQLDLRPTLRSDFVVPQEPIITFVTTDNLSGIDYYSLKLINLSDSRKNGSDAFFTEISSPYKLPDSDPGQYEIIVRAFDGAFNFTDSAKKIEIIPNNKFIYISRVGISIFIWFFSWTQVTLMLIILMIVLALVIYLEIKYRKRLRRIEKSFRKAEAKFKKNEQEIIKKLHE
ncbi:MAG: cohesin domain-containing protein [bacterium]|nr:cohesin domain-containing protein [bacterium]